MHRRRFMPIGAAALLAALTFAIPDAVAHDAKPSGPTGPTAPVATAVTPCVNGSAGSYPCKNVDLQSQLPLSSMGGGNGSGGWGWTDSTTGKEYAIVARTNGTSFVDISDAANPVYLGNLPSPTGTSSWREVNVYNNTVYIVSDNNGSHGLQVFDLTKLRNVASPPATFTADHRNTDFGRGHTVSINYQTGYLSVNGSDTCSGGPRIYNLANRLQPAFVSCISADGYTHDSQLAVYHGPDTRYQGKEILLASNEDTVTLWDMTNKTSPTQLARKTYSGSAYTHQGWLTEDHKYFLVDDELDEQNFSHNSKTYVWNMSDLTNPTLTGTFLGPTAATDHNQWIKGNYSYQSNYRAGLRILDLTNVANPSTMTEAAYFDVYPSTNANGFAGTWTNYPYYPSGNVAVFSIQDGLFVVKPNLGGGGTPTVTNPGNQTGTVGTPASLQLNASGGTAPYSWTATGLPAGLSINASTGAISGTPSTAGTYSVTATAKDAANKTGSTTFDWTIGTAPPPSCSGTNGTDVAIPDNATVESSITISGCSGNASASSTVEVHIQHTYIGDLVVSLVAPDGTAYTLHNRTGSGTDNIDKTYTVNVSGETANGTWKLKVQDAASQDTGKIDTWTLNLGGGTPPPPACGGTNGTDVAIPDNTTVESPITVSGCSGNASATSSVEVHIRHTYIGDLVVSLVAPDGTVYTLHNRTGSGTDNIDRTFTVNLSSEVKNGTWKLRVQDAAAQDTGTIDTWTLTL